MPEEGLRPTDTAQFKLLVVIVLYKLRPADSAAFTTLRTAMSHIEAGQRDIKVLLYDNTPGGCNPGALPQYAIYKAADRNAGVAGAYNCALQMAVREGFTWLLTLDYDTSLPPHFLIRMRELTLRFESDNRVAAIVPQLSDAGRLLSPDIVRPWGNSILPHGFTGIPNGEIHAFNSASVFRVRALRQIGGFSRYFWLDFLDAWVFRHLHLRGQTVYVAGDIQVEHELSLLNLKHRLTLDRFSNFLKAECAYTDLYRGRIGRLALTARLFGRLYRQKKRGEDVAIRRLTAESLKRRMLQSKRRRIIDWKKEMEAHPAFPICGHDAQVSTTTRPDVSVCMAACNGEKYIAAQLRSLLCQLAERDEVVVVDDASTDGTAAIVEGFRDSRIRLFRNSCNRGAVASFERALMESRGDIVFLSDQDDLWNPDKVSRLLEAFNDPKITLVLSDASIIDAEGKTIAPSYFTTRGGFVSGVMRNILSNHYVGCTMSFRRELLQYCLPFPGNLPMHDSWIGIVNDSFGKTCYIAEPLIAYRRHETNLSRRGNRMHQIVWRASLFANIAALRIRKTSRVIAAPN